jgi:quercetin dioxygenase-like cupin family protein
MSDKKGYFFTEKTTKVEKLERGIHKWFSRPDITDSDDLIVVQVDVEPGGGHPFHIHPAMDEVIYILSGEAEQWIEKEKRSLKAGDAVFIPKKWSMPHSTKAISLSPSWPSSGQRPTWRAPWFMYQKKSPGKA